MPALRTWLVTLPLLFAALPVLAQQQPAQPDAGQPPAQNGNSGQNVQPQSAAPAQQLPPDTVRPNYVLGPNDQILIRAPEAEEINQKPFRIDGDGNINLPLVGRVHAAGMTLQELEVDLVRRLREYIREPQVFVDMVQFRSAPVYFTGLFVRPGFTLCRAAAL